MKGRVFVLPIKGSGTKNRTRKETVSKGARDNLWKQLALPFQPLLKNLGKVAKKSPSHAYEGVLDHQLHLPIGRAVGRPSRIA